MIVFKNIYIQYSLFTILFLLSISSLAQNNDKNDINYWKHFTDSLLKNGTDTILIGGYVDYGRAIHEFIFWKEDGKGVLQMLQGKFSKKNIYDDALIIDLEIYKNYRLDTMMHSAIQTNSYISHDNAWVFNIKTRNKFLYLNVFDYVQKDNPTDIRCMWVKSIENKVKKYW